MKILIVLILLGVLLVSGCTERIRAYTDYEECEPYLHATVICEKCFDDCEKFNLEFSGISRRFSGFGCWCFDTVRNISINMW